MTVSDFPASKNTIMVVDDNPDLVSILKTLLKIKGYEVQTAYSGQEALNLLQDQKPDWIEEEQYE
jgi:CheY-like chemotaxis protein